MPHLRLALSLVALVACSDDESPIQVLAGYMDQPWAACVGHGENVCGSAALIVQCMNDALASGGSAEYVESQLDDHMFTFSIFFFTVDGRVTYFVDHPGGDATHGQGYADEYNCAGPFALGSGTFCYGSNNVIVEGCPP